MSNVLHVFKNIFNCLFKSNYFSSNKDLIFEVILKDKLWLIVVIFYNFIITLINSKIRVIDSDALFNWSIVV